jgi:folate-dependent phosphoribosylglycinamide formyltransferase PurN
MRVVLFTVEEPAYVPELLAATLERHSGQIVAAYVSRGPVRKWLKRTAFLAREGYPFCIRPDDWFRFAKLRLLGQRKDKHKGGRVFDHLQSHGIPTEYIKEIRTEQTRSKLAALKPDVFLFCPFDRIAGPKFLGIPKIGTFNVHLGKLPEYRGSLSSFWVLRFGDSEAGATVHQAVEELDAGDIVAEVRIPVATASMHQLMLDTVRAASPMLAGALDLIEGGAWQPVDSTGRPDGYHRLPGFRDYRAFYARGCRLI